MLTHHSIMRTTLDIDDDVLRAAKELAQRERVSAGQVVSRLLFRSSNPQVVTNEQVNAMRDQEGL
jgi:hypothetical protein